MKSQDKASAVGRSVFRASLLGELVDCFSMKDAVLINAANKILGTGDCGPYSPARLRRLIAVLNRHGRFANAEALARMVARRRAEEVLNSIGYERPVR